MSSDLVLSGRLWKLPVDEFEIFDTGGQAHLLSACRAEDDIVAWRDIIAAEGPVLKNDPSKPHWARAIFPKLTS